MNCALTILLPSVCCGHDASCPYNTLLFTDKHKFCPHFFEENWLLYLAFFFPHHGNTVMLHAILLYTNPVPDFFLINDILYTIYDILLLFFSRE